MAVRATVTARSTSSDVHTGIRAIKELSKGARTSNAESDTCISPASGIAVIVEDMTRTLVRSGDTESVHPYLEPHRDGGFIPFAHRGGTSEAPENTLAAFRHAVSLGFSYLETDVRLTADGHLVAFHDDDLERTCATNGRISAMSWDEVSRVRVGGREPMPLLVDLFEEFPHARINIDAKSDSTVDPLIALLRRMDVLDRVCIGSFSHRRLERVRGALGPRVCTSASPREVVSWLYGRVPEAPSCFQVPVRQGPVTVVNRRSLRRAKAAEKPVHVWTIDEAHQMQALIDLEVDGIMTDQCDVLKSVTIANGLWTLT